MYQLPKERGIAMFKKILCFTLICLLIGGLVFAAQPGRKESPGTGTIVNQGGYDWDPPKTFRLVRYAQVDGGQDTTNDYLTKDSIVIWALSNDGITITTTVITDDSRVAGIIATNTPIQVTSGNTAQDDYGQQNWGWLQTYGLAEVTVASTLIYNNPNTGDALGTSSVAGSADICYAGAQTTPAISLSTQNLGNAGVFLNSATSSEANVKVFVSTE